VLLAGLRNRSMSPINLDDQDARIDADIRFADSVFAWCVRNVSQQVARKEGDRAIKWAILAGKVANTFCSSKLADEKLESALRQIGRGFPESLLQRDALCSTSLRWLHVLTGAYETGGHTALCRRWIELDQSGDTHDLALTCQEVSIPKDIQDAVDAKGGRIHLLDSSSMMDRAVALRQLAFAADVVVLHTHMWEPLPTIAFAIPNGPPVFLLNHADHAYWTGGSVADLILNIRPSGEVLCESNRGNGASFRLPIPIPRPEVVRDDPRGIQLRDQLGIPTAATVFLTIGSAYKYVPTKEMNFLETAKNILQQVKGSYLIAVGPQANDPLWLELAKNTDNRAIAVGVQKGLDPYFAAADVYLEGFPFGSLTALLEAVLAGLPPVLAPKCCPLPYRSDDFSLVDLDVPNDPAHYTKMAIELGIRIENGLPALQDFRSVALRTHCEPEWLQGLTELRNLVIKGVAHDPKPLAETQNMSGSVIRYWANFTRYRQIDNNAFGYAFQYAMDEELCPRVDSEMYEALRDARKAGLKVASPAKSYFASALLSCLPNSLAKAIYFKN
jgi:hypothetical protein